MRRPGLLGPKDFKKLTDEELYDVKVEGQPGSNYWKLAEAEQQRRQSIKDKKSAWYESKGFWVAFAALIVTVLSFGVPYLISYLNREEARLNQKINEETARAYVQVTSFSLDPSAMFGKPDFNRKFVQGFVTILNSGKVAANGIRIMLDANPPHADRYFVVVEKDNLAPGASEMLRIEIPITSSRDFTVLDDSREFVVELKTEYDDGVHADKKTYSEMFCIAESKTVTHQLTPLYSCNTHFDKGSSDVR